MPAAEETAARLRRLGFDPVLAPALTIHPRPRLDAGDAQAMLITSANAADALPRVKLPVLAVGGATAAAVRACGLADVRAAGGDARALAALTTASLDPDAGPLLLASGARQGFPLAAALRAAGFRVRRRVAYAARPIPTLPAEALAAFAAGRIGWALFFSAETVHAFRAALSRAEADATVAGVGALAIGEPAAEALAGLPWRLIRVAQEPTQEALLDMLPR